LNLQAFSIDNFTKGDYPMLQFLEGKRTYLVAIGVIATAVGQYLTGDATVAEAVNAALVGLGLATLRAAK
jgi:hypothetical protein